MGNKNKDDNTVTLCEKIKLQQIYCPTEEWSVFHKIYRIIQKETILASNKVMSICNIYNSLSDKNEQNKWLLNTYNNEKIRNVLYNIARNYCKYSYSKNANAVSNDIYKKYFCGSNSYKNKITKGEGNPPMTFTEKIPLYIVAQDYKIGYVDYDKHYYSIDVPLLNLKCRNGIEIEKSSKTKKKEVNDVIPVNNTHLKFGINASGNKRLIAILENIIIGNYKMGDSKLQRVKSKNRSHKYDYYFLLSYTKPKKHIETLKQENVLGIDLGMVVPAYCSVNYCDYLRKPVGGKKIIQQNKIQERKNRELQRDIKYNLRDGHGRKYKLDGFNGNSNKIANRNKTYNYNLAKEIVDLAIQWECGTIHMEDLTGIHASKPEDRFLKSWTYYDLQQKIKNKAEENGITVRYIDPHYTSQTCSKCGHHESGQRLNQATFQCKACGYSVNADYNAARNIAMSTKYTDKKLEEVS